MECPSNPRTEYVFQSWLLLRQRETWCPGTCKGLSLSGSHEKYLSFVRRRVSSSPYWKSYQNSVNVGFSVERLPLTSRRSDWVELRIVVVREEKYFRTPTDPGSTTVYKSGNRRHKNVSIVERRRMEDLMATPMVNNPTLVIDDSLSVIYNIKKNNWKVCKCRRINLTPVLIDFVEEWEAPLFIYCTSIHTYVCVSHTLWQVFEN